RTEPWGRGSGGGLERFQLATHLLNGLVELLDPIRQGIHRPRSLSQGCPAGLPAETVVGAREGLPGAPAALPALPPQPPGQASSACQGPEHRG
ncbi:MAG: hypothetical protein ACK56I_06535, partial [bacterium]